MPSALPHPSWLRAPLPRGPLYEQILAYHRQGRVRSVCYEAACPNRGECWSLGTMTFLLLGNACSRNCRFCNVANGTPLAPDADEPQRLAAMVMNLRLRHAVFTTVTRDDLVDGGAAHIAATVEAVRRAAPACRSELLISDLQGSRDALATILAAAPAVLGHNIETVPRLYEAVRPQADYAQSLKLLTEARRRAPRLPLKSGLMLGLGEHHHEVLEVLRDLHAAGVSLLTLGQYLAPSAEHLPVLRYLSPEEFAELAELARDIGFAGVEAGPLVRSSYHAAEQYEEGLYA